VTGTAIVLKPRREGEDSMAGEIKKVSDLWDEVLAHEAQLPGH
jgi:hypothetical protein